MQIDINITSFDSYQQLRVQVDGVPYYQALIHPRSGIYQVIPIGSDSLKMDIQSFLGKDAKG